MFEPGMAYVALSRVRTLGGLALLNFEPSNVKANKRVHEEIVLTVEGPVKLKKWKLKSEGSSRELYEWILGKRPKVVHV